MPIEGFDPQEFAKSLAHQATDLAPANFSTDNKNYIVSKVYQFCMLAGDAINKDPELKLTAAQATIVSQFIGEWTFHKCVDIIKSDIQRDVWDHILQTLAFAVFEVAKKTQVQGLSSDDAVKVVEEAVKANYEKIIHDLASQGKLDKEKINAVLSQSNIDEMAVTNNPQQQDPKFMKLASIALLLTTFSNDKAERILAGMSEEQAIKIREYMQVKDLDQKLDASVALGHLSEFKNKFNSLEPKIPAVMSNIKNFSNLYTEEEILNIVANEREHIKKYVKNSLLEAPDINGQYLLSSPISKIVYNFIRSKLSA